MLRYWVNPLVNILHFGPSIQGSDGSGAPPPATGTTGFRKGPRYLIGTLPIQTPTSGPLPQGASGVGGDPPTGTTGYLKRPGYVIGTLPIQTPDLARKIFGTDGIVIPPVEEEPQPYDVGHWAYIEHRSRQKKRDEEKRQALARIRKAETKVTRAQSSARGKVNPRLITALADLQRAQELYDALLNAERLLEAARLMDDDDAIAVLLLS